MKKLKNGNLPIEFSFGFADRFFSGFELLLLLGFESCPSLVGIDFEEAHEVFDRGRVECFVDKGLVGEESEVVNQGFHVW